jgi:hypothetical protein
MGITKLQDKSRQVIREWHRISCTHTNPYIIKTAKWHESPHTSQYLYWMLMASTPPSKDTNRQTGLKKKTYYSAVYKKPTSQTQINIVLG